MPVAVVIVMVRVVIMSMVIMIVPVSIVTVAVRFFRSRVARVRFSEGRLCGSIHFAKCDLVFFRYLRAVIELGSERYASAAPPGSLAADGSPRRFDLCFFSLPDAAFDNVPPDAERCGFCEQNLFKTIAVAWSADHA